MPNGRCRMHGGKSTGARTPEGTARAAAANLKHGFYTAEMVAERRRARMTLRESIRLLRLLTSEAG
jgi:hypothetical protein